MPQILNIQHQMDVSDIIASEIKATEQYLAQLKALEAPPEDSEVQEKLGGGHYTLGSKLKPTTIEDFCHLHNLPKVRFRVDLGDYMSKQLQAHNKPLPDGRWIHFKPGDELRPFQFLKVNYKSYGTWKVTTDYLRCNPNFFGQPRYDFVLFTGDVDQPVFGQIKHLFVCKLGGTQYALALVQPYKVVNLLRRPRSDRDCGLLRVRREAESEYIWVDSIIRGALVVASASAEDEKLVVDTIDYDMFLRVKKHWPHYTDNQ
ncbi:hypothetical protein PQX77_016731 [Marasmius sp. AFHP31]|nr:hypothetical protein PQX77_016731 [Marasmius sp. AFHP31]